MADLDGSNGLRKEFKAVGRANVPGRLSYSIATGRAKFGSDAVVPDMLHAKYLRSPYGRVKLKSMDVSKAKALEGVVDIVTWDDPEVLAIKGAREPLIPNEAETEDEEIGAVVVAETPEICDEALRLIEVQWDVLPTIVDAEILCFNRKSRSRFQGGGPHCRIRLGSFGQGISPAEYKRQRRVVGAGSVGSRRQNPLH
jgi:xanthine dehydrogenase molybdopterin-binding subunit B